MCDCLVALPDASAAAGATLFAKNSDRPPDEAQVLEWHSPRRDRGPLRTTYVEVPPAPGDTLGVLGSRPWWMWGFEHGVNEAGVAGGNEAIYTRTDPRSFPPALTGMDLVRLALERAPTAAAAVEVVTGLLERHGQGGSGHHGRDRPYWSSFLFADPGDAWVVETSATTWMAEQVDRVRAISNRTTIPAFDAEHRHERQPVEALVDPRWRASQAVLAAVPVSVRSLKAHLRSHDGPDGGWTVCMHVPGVEATTAAVVAELGRGVRPVARVVLGSPCTSIFVPVVVGHPPGEVPAWQRFAALGPRHRDGLLSVEAELEDRLDAADPEWNRRAWRLVDAALTAAGV